MKNFRQHSITVQIADVEVKTRRKTDETVPKKNPKIDLRLLEEYERLVAAVGSDVRLRTRGADYNLAPPTRTQEHAYGCLSSWGKSEKKRSQPIDDTASRGKGKTTAICDCAFWVAGTTDGGKVLFRWRQHIRLMRGGFLSRSLSTRLIAPLQLTTGSFAKFASDLFQDVFC